MSSSSLPPTPSVIDPTADEPAAPHLAPALPAAPEDEGNWVEYDFNAPGRNLTAEEKWPSEWHTVAWLAAHGVAQTQIAVEVGYSVTNVSVIMNKPLVQEKIERIRREFLGTESLGKKFAVDAKKAAAFLGSVIEGKEKANTGQRIDASKWMLEKATGKAKQALDIDAGGGIRELLQGLSELREEQKRQAAGTEPADTAIDVTPKKTDWVDDWVAKHVTEVGSEKESGGKNGEAEVSAGSSGSEETGR